MSHAARICIDWRCKRFSSAKLLITLVYRDWLIFERIFSTVYFSWSSALIWCNIFHVNFIRWMFTIDRRSSRRQKKQTNLYLTMQLKKNIRSRVHYCFFSLTKRFSLFILVFILSVQRKINKCIAGYIWQSNGLGHMYIVVTFETFSAWRYLLTSHTYKIIGRFTIRCCRYSAGLLLSSYMNISFFFRRECCLSSS